MKKNMKKVAVGSMVSCAMLFSLTACTKQRSAEEVLQDSFKASAKQESIDVTGKIENKYESGKEKSSGSMNLGLDFNLKGQDLKKDPKATMDATVNVLGMSVDMNMYYKDGYYYTSSYGSKQKEKMSTKELQNTINQLTGDPSIPMKCYKDIKLTKKDGINVVSYSIDGKEYAKYQKEKTKKENEEKGVTITSTGIDTENITSMKGERYLNDKDLPTKETLTIVTDNKKESTDNDNNLLGGLGSGKSTAKIKLTYHNPGKSVTVKLPKDLNTYKTK